MRGRDNGGHLSVRLTALTALALAAATTALAALGAVSQFPRGLLALAAVAAAMAAAFFGLVRRGVSRVLGLGLAAVLIGSSVVFLGERGDVLTVLVAICAALTIATVGTAFRVHVDIPGAPRPQQPVLFYNPRSGGGKAERLALPDEARARGIEAVELAAGQNLEELVRAAVARGADALAMAGGDGSQAIVAAIAAEHSLPYACVPAGTRNHFALDLGVDRDDAVGALDAFVDGGERVVDLADVNGRVFVNNVSLGIYAEAIRRPEYRNAKLRTLLGAIPDVVGPGSAEAPLRFTTPDGALCEGNITVLVSNNRYRVGTLVGSGTRPQMDQGLLGVIAVGGSTDASARSAQRPGPWRQWATSSFIVEAGGPLAAGIDGEAAELETPLQFRSRPGALRVRIARAHPGASPSALAPERMRDGLRALFEIALGREPRRGNGARPPGG